MGVSDGQEVILQAVIQAPWAFLTCGSNVPSSVC